jgi:FHA domain-containing protein
MPQVTLEVVSMDSAALPVARSCRFDGDGGTIGRDEGNTFVLPDKHRRVSRLHAAVGFPLGVPTITNASTSLPISIGDVPLDCGRTSRLVTGDVLEIGPYILRVQSATVPELDAPTLVVPAVLPAAAPPPPLAGAAAAGNGDPFANLFPGIGSSIPATSAVPVAPRSGGPIDDPLAGLFDGYGQADGPRLGEVSGLSVDPLSAMGLGSDSGAGPYNPIAPRAKGSTVSIIPEDFNPFDLPSGTERNSADPLSSLLGDMAAQPIAVGNQGEPSIDSLFTSAGPSTFDGILNQSGAVSSSPQGLDVLLPTPADSDPFAMFGDRSPSGDGLMRPVRDDLAEIGGAYQPPRAVEANFGSRPRVDQYVATAMAAAQSAPAPACGADALTQAFLNGAQLPLSTLPGGLTPEIMMLVGSVLRSATAGAVDMLAARTATKMEVQASVTIISSHGNNPLKFLPNGEAALIQLLSKTMPGFMRADEAMKDAFDDLRAHEVGVIAGTRAALAEVLGRFDPTVLGERLTSGSFIESFLPSVRKTKLWDIYLERYAQIRREAEDDFQSIFGRAFVQAYERETARMKARVTEAGESR